MAQEVKNLSDRLWKALDSAEAACEQHEYQKSGEKSYEERVQHTSGQLENRGEVNQHKRQQELRNSSESNYRVKKYEDSAKTREGYITSSSSQADYDLQWRSKNSNEKHITTNRYFITNKVQSDQHINWRKKNSDEDDKSTFSDGKHFNRIRDQYGNKDKHIYTRERKPSFRSNHEESNMHFKKSGDSNFLQYEHKARNNNVSEPFNQKSNVVGGKPITRQRLSYKTLEELSLQSASQIIFVLANEYSGFDDLLKSNISSDNMVLILKVLAKACDVKFDEIKIAILSPIMSDEFLGQLKKFVLDLPLKRVSGRDITFNNILKFCQNIMTHLPHTAGDKLEDIIVSSVMSINGIQEFHSEVVSDDVKTQFLELHSNVKKIKENRKKCENKYRVDHCTPPNNFREINIFPSREDVLSKEPAFIRPNIIKGAYADVEHYLDVQFRLLHEDFVGPLRDGIHEYKEQMYSGRKSGFRLINGLRIYRHVIFLGPSTFQNKVGYIVSFDPRQRLKHVQWQYSKRLIYGSLLLFTNDDFRNIIFGTVLARDTEFLKRGEILIEFCRQTDSHSLDGEYVMVESDVYFEPYRQVLRALQMMTVTDFPMERYVISVNCEVEPPSYLKGMPHPVYRVGDHSVPVLKLDEWPSATDLQLDISQYSAFQSALTKEFAIIQGPPGTGKTYLGLRIAEVLMSNLERNSPLLVVCFTNHALDQFLEGISKFTQSLVRVGGQSRNDALKSYNLKEIRKHTTGDSKDQNVAVKCVYRRLKRLLEEIRATERSIRDIEENNGIVSARTFHGFGIITQEHYMSFVGQGKLLINLGIPGQFINWLSDSEAHDSDDDDECDFENHMASDKSEDQHEESDSLTKGVAEKEEVEMDREAEDAIFALEDVADDKLTAPLLGSTLHFDLSFEKLHPLQQLIHLKSDHDSDQEKSMQLLERKKYFRQKLFQTHHVSENTIRKLERHKNLWLFSIEERWQIYKYWILRLKKALQGMVMRLEQEYQSVWKEYIELQQMADLEILQKYDVVGMTTTGAAKQQTLLQALKPKIVIIEEAAEVLESHIIVSLTSYCEHLILIGDHKQLKPSTAVYNLAKNFNFDVSLFERMIKNGMACDQLKVQHRMRPEIAQLIVPTIYPNLENHPSVLEFKDIEGVTKNLFFITHNYPESDTDDSQSHQNVYEAEFLIQFCRHLVLQGYEQSKITILGAYSGQMILIKKMKQKFDLLDAVRVSVVDNFQGEENDIILLSLVRNNKEGKIGFLKTANRVCVALSRARKGFYIMGNMDMLVSQSKVWPKINATLKAQDAVGTHLALRCQVHPSSVTKVATTADFRKNTPEGGCLQICNVPLTCGHQCMQICHIMDRNHENYKCRVKCQKVLCELEHKCEKFCYEDCEKCMVPLLKVLPCGHEVALPCHVNPEQYNCSIAVMKEIPHCQHKVNMDCSVNPLNVTCPFLCEIPLQCGHSCEKRCHVLQDPDHLEYKCLKPCTRKYSECTENHTCVKKCWEECGKCLHWVTLKLSCGHFYDMQCSWDRKYTFCRELCNKMLSCGHLCQLQCYAPCGICYEMVTKVIEECGHSIKTSCYHKPSRKQCWNQCNKMLPCGHQCNLLCKDICTLDCQELVPSPILPACGHKSSIFCSLKNNNDIMSNPKSEILLASCREPCEVLLQCGHKCQGTCATCLQGRIHKACEEKCGRTLICGHSCGLACNRSCSPCDRKCEYSCRHLIPNYKCKRKNCKQPLPCIHAYRKFRCPNKCGNICIQCVEKCEWKCEHYKCTKKCYEICDRPPCNEPCKKQLKCGHPCVGYCGEMCPLLCRICDAHALTEEFFLYGMEGEEDSRFVYLEDCGHTIEAKGLEHWLTHSGEGDKEITRKTCPRCNTTITRNFRFGNVIREWYGDFHVIQKKICTEEKYTSRKRSKLFRMTRVLPQRTGCTVVDTIVQNISTILNYYYGTGGKFGHYFSRLRELHGLVIQSICAHCNILIAVHRLMNTVASKVSLDMKSKFSEHACKLLQIMSEHELFISHQELDDFKLELLRLHRIAEFYQIKARSNSVPDQENVKLECDKSEEMIFSIERYSYEIDSTVSNLHKDLAKNFPDILTEMEMKLIEQDVVAMDAAGDWFKCQNNHYYSLGNCARAMEVGQCNECKAKVDPPQNRVLVHNPFVHRRFGAPPTVHYNPAIRYPYV